MKQRDLRDKLKRVKYAVSKETTIYLNGRYIGFRHPDLGIAFLRRSSNGVYTQKNGRVIWYHSMQGSITDAARHVKKEYSLKIPTAGWDVLRVKHYNTTTPEEIVEVLNIT